MGLSLGGERFAGRAARRRGQVDSRRDGPGYAPGSTARHDRSGHGAWRGVSALRTGGPYASVGAPGCSDGSRTSAFVKIRPPTTVHAMATERMPA